MPAPQDTRALDAMRESVATMRRDLDQAMAALAAVRGRLDTTANALEVAERVESERRERAELATRHREARRG